MMINIIFIILLIKKKINLNHLYYYNFHVKDKMKNFMMNYLQIVKSLYIQKANKIKIKQNLKYKVKLKVDK